VEARKKLHILSIIFFCCEQRGKDYEKTEEQRERKRKREGAQLARAFF
jgi:hypothetical protein